MFWGLIMEPGRRYSQKVKKSFRVTMAAIDVSTCEKEPSQVMCSYEGRNYLLCTLRKPDILQCSLDLEFASGTQVSFASNGNAHIHLTGYLVDVDEEDGLTLADLEEQEEEELVEEEESTEKIDKKKRIKKENAEAPPSKKARLSNGSIQEEEESDDPDFEEGEAESNDEEASDEEVEEECEEEEDGDDDESSEDAEEEEVKAQVVKKKSNKKQQEGAKVNGNQKNDKKAQVKNQKKVLSKGVIIEDLVEGSGPVAKPGRYINVYYEGRLEKNNKVFDSMNKGPGFKFRLGGGEVIKAWDIGVAGMKVGGKRKIVCPPLTAYGAKGSPPGIPPSSTLVFTVELKKVN